MNHLEATSIGLLELPDGQMGCGKLVEKQFQLHGMMVYQAKMVSLPQIGSQYAKEASLNGWDCGLMPMSLFDGWFIAGSPTGINTSQQVVNRKKYPI